MDEALPADASTLIYLAKADAFDQAANCITELLVPTSVWREAVLEGERIGAAEVPRIRAAAEAGYLRAVELDDEQQAQADAIAAQHRIGVGESEVLAVGLTPGTVVVDEGRASRVAAALGMKPLSTLFLPVVGYRSGRLSSRQALALLRQLAIVVRPSADALYALERHLHEETP